MIDIVSSQATFRASQSQSIHMKSLLSLLLAPFLFSCSANSNPAATTGSTVSSPKTFPELTAAEKIRLGNQIWKNESGGKVTGLTHWNVGEEFPSLGIGHFIWYPKGFNGKFVESFPKFVAYAQAQRVKGIPSWLLSTPDCPWNTKADFDRDFNGSKLAGLRTFLKNNVQLQTEFIIASSRSALGKILKAAPQADRARITNNYAKVASTPNGTYALIDYVNFKGDGTSPSERYNNQGWGLLQVLSNMRHTSSGQHAAKAFSDSAKAMLLRRVKNSPPTRGESRWTAGWNNRCDTYARPF